MFREAILCWSLPPGQPRRVDRGHAAASRPAAGLRQAWKVLDGALRRRFRREMRRLLSSNVSNRA
jgi:hypothetical protein